MKGEEKIAVVLGSKSDVSKLQSGLDLFEELKLPYELKIISAHRNPEELRQFCKSVKGRKIQVVIACAGMAAALPGFIASYVSIPVIGVALDGGLLGGLDALFSMVSSPKGIGLASTGVGKSAFINAIILSLAILTLKDESYALKLDKLKNKFK